MAKYKICTTCNKKVEGFKSCRCCGESLCYGCFNKSLICSECFMIKKEKEIVNDYFIEKYAQSKQTELSNQ